METITSEYLNSVSVPEFTEDMRQYAKNGNKEVNIDAELITQNIDAYVKARIIAQRFGLLLNKVQIYKQIAKPDQPKDIYQDFRASGWKVEAKGKTKVISLFR